MICMAENSSTYTVETGLYYIRYRPVNSGSPEKLKRAQSAAITLVLEYISLTGFRETVLIVEGKLDS